MYNLVIHLKYYIQRRVYGIYLYFDVLLQRRRQSCEFRFDAGCRVVEYDSVAAGLCQAIGAE